MPVSTEELRLRLEAFDFPRLFVDGLGWDHYQAEPLVLPIDGQEYALRPVAEKANFAVFECAPGRDDAIPQYPVRRKIETQVTKRAFEHLVIFVDAARTQQVWQWVKRQPDRPPVCREHHFHTGQTGQPLLQRLNGFIVTLEDEARGIGITDVVSRVGKALDVEKVTKRFYQHFQAELAAFGDFIEGITSEGDRDWYASLMLNRMMFVYFIQRQRFLDDNADYLRTKLRQVQGKYGDGRFQQFYREFLLRLFHEGLGQPEAQRAPELAALLGRVPFLNGGLFEVHDLERDNPGIAIPDAAFERVFDFFDGYRWHLDERRYGEDNEINPDVLGYIFEKYINQKQMGAYYTKEDITGYISRSTVIPFLFDAAKKDCPVAFKPGGGVWRLLQEDPNRYIHPAISHGLTCNARQEPPAPLDTPSELPTDIAAGVKDVSCRGGWNAPAPEGYGLPAETWREVVARRQRYEEVHIKLAAGELTEINDLVTLNLDIERFARDVIAQSEGPELLRAFWHAMRDVSILDPACGSGAFLFAALNVLEPLYTACLEGMRGFLDDASRSERRRSPGFLEDFRKVLEEAEEHPSERYFILKSIVLKNLFGVDIMDEAVEICKLRLFLKLVAQLKTYDQVEPLPDIDFNVRAGNTLVGFTSLDALRQAMTTMPNGQHRHVFPEEQAALNRIDEEAEITSRVFDQFRLQQTILGGEVTSADKQALRDRLGRLASEMDRYLATGYGISPYRSPEHSAGPDREVNCEKTIHRHNAYECWRSSHRPFHWLAEFYGIMSKGGFDVVVGNPPYVEYSKVRTQYTVSGYQTAACGNLYAMMMERSLTIIMKTGRFGMIVPVSAACTAGFAPLRSLLATVGGMVVSHFNDRPSRLFDGIEHCRLSIFLLSLDPSENGVFSTKYNKWQAPERDTLFQRLAYVEATRTDSDGILPKFGSSLEPSILRKLHGAPSITTPSSRRSSSESIFYTRKLSSFVQILDFVPTIYDEAGKLRRPSELKEIRFDNGITRGGVLAFLNSTLFYWLVTVFSDCRNLNKREIELTRLDLADKSRIQELATVAEELMDDIRSNSEMLTINYRTMGSLRIQATYPRLSKPIIDRIDAVLAQHFGLTQTELDFLVNFDYKYRMGSDESARQRA